MSTQIEGVTVASLTRAIESKDAGALAGFYANGATMRIMDRDNPPSNPREIKGRGAIAGFYDDVCSRPVTRRVETSVCDGDRLALTQICAYPDGARVFCSIMLELTDGKIVRQTTVQAWDA